MKTVYDKDFDNVHNDGIFLIIPDVYADDRGYFTEVLKSHGQWPKDNMPLWFTELMWIKQINRSQSKAGTIRGCHAQKGIHCQAKLVEAVNTKVYDIITDARPDSRTFGLTKAYVLDPIALNKLYVAKGFLHAFAVPFGSEDAIFLYYCDSTFNKRSEIGVNPMSLLPQVVSSMKQQDLKSKQYTELYELFDRKDELLLSEKDCAAESYEDFMSEVKAEYDTNKKLWYQ